MPLEILEKNLETQEIMVNCGPQHPSTHGLFRMILKLDGETVTDCVPIVGYLHRGLDKIAENRTYTQFIPYTDRLDYLAAMCNNLAYVQTVEKLMGLEIPERAEYIRVIMAELSRIASHIVCVGAFALVLGGWSMLEYALRDREDILDLFEMVCGSRMTFNYMRIGGVADDLPDEFIPALKKVLAKLPACFDEYDGLVTGNEIFLARTKGVSVVTPQEAINWGMSGVMLRATGVQYDLRKAEPCSIYDRFDFEIPVGQNGDTFDRWWLRIAEMRQSTRIIEQAMNGLPGGEIMAKVPKVIKPPVGEVYHQFENPKGILGFYLVSDGSTKPYRLHIRRPTFIHLAALPDMLRGWKIADAIAIFAGLDAVLGEVDA